MKKQPNIVFFFTDQQRWDTCGCYGQSAPVTPNLDAMACDGVLYEHNFSCQPVCGPARSALQTGLYPTETGCFRNDINLPVNRQTIAHHFNRAGYETAYIGKWHLASDSGRGIDYKTKAVPEKYRGGWKDEWIVSDVLEFTSHGYGGHMFDSEGNKKEFGEDVYRVDAQTDWALDYLQNRKDRSKPFFLFLSYIEPHHQNDRKRFEGPDGSKEAWADAEVPGDMDGKEGDWPENWADYLGCCHSLDGALGRIRAELKAQGLEDDTVVVFTSDHGCHFRTRNGEYKRTCHESSIRTPLVISGPGFRGGRRVEALSSLIDLPPTLLECADIPVPREMRGRALNALGSGETSEHHSEVFLQLSENHIGRAIRTDRWKYEVWVPQELKTVGWEGPGNIAWDEAGSMVYHEFCLYDLEQDPLEQKNLIWDEGYAEIKQDLAERLKAWMVKVGEGEPEILPPAKEYEQNYY